jgi:hypothetical protein
MVSTKEMLADGWKRKTINGVRCLLHPEFGFVGLPGKDHFYPTELIQVTQKLGMPDRIHTYDNQVQTIEYFNLVEETA